jgi:hypothetical protein
MTDDIIRAYLDVEEAMDRYTKALEAHVVRLRNSESSDPTQLERMTYGARAMRDSAMIYLSYAKFIAQGMPQSEEVVRDELQS